MSDSDIVSACRPYGGLAAYGKMNIHQILNTSVVVQINV